jgi:hypothetical protein
MGRRYPGSGLKAGGCARMRDDLHDLGTSWNCQEQRRILETEL